MQITPWDKVQELLPPLSTSEFNALRRSIEKDGVKQPIMVLPDGRIIDGHHRWEIAGNECPYKVEDLPEDDAFGLALILNWARRQMSKDQQDEVFKKLDRETKQRIAVKLRDEGMTQAETATELGTAQNTVSSWESEGNTTNINPDISCIPPDYRVKIPKEHHSIIHDRSQDGETQERIAADYKVSQQAIGKIIKKVEKKIERDNIPIPEPATTTATLSPTLIVAHAKKTGLPDESIDLIITSPPYNLGSEKWPMGGSGREPRENGIGYTDSVSEEEYQHWQIECLIEMHRVAKPGASFFYNHKVRQKNGAMIHPLDWLRNENNPWIIRQEIIWDRGSTHNHCPVLFWPHDERIYWMTKGNPVLPNRPIGMPTIWNFHGPVSGTWHPAPFSEELPRKCIEAVGRDGITILDPFAGSCTTLKVALEYGYNVIGIDVSAEYLEEAIKENKWTFSNEH